MGKLSAKASKSMGQAGNKRTTTVKISNGTKTITAKTSTKTN